MASRAVPGSRVDAGGVFGSLALSTNINLASRHWAGVVRKMRKDADLVADCVSDSSKCRQSVRLLSGFIERNKGKPVDSALLDRVNRFANRGIRYSSDRKVFGFDEYWASPSEVMGGRGDCEDYVTTKFFILSQLGVRDRNMKVVVVRDLVSGIGHAVLAVTVAGRTLILDNQSTRVRDHLKVSRYQPLYSINRKSAWLNLAVKRVRASSPLARKGVSDNNAPPVRFASLHNNIAVHLAKRKPLLFVRSSAGSHHSEAHF